MSAPLNGTTIEGMQGGVPGVRSFGLNTNQPINFSGTTINTTGAISSNATVTGPTGSFGVLQVTTAASSTGGTGASASLVSNVGAAAGGPATGAQSGWMKVTIAGSQYYVPVWS